MEGASDEQCYLFRRARRPRALDKGLRFAPETGEVERKSLGYEPDELASWIKPLPQPTKCFYESGVTGFHLCRELRAMGVGRVGPLNPVRQASNVASPAREQPPRRSSPTSVKPDHLLLESRRIHTLIQPDDQYASIVRQHDPSR